MSKQTKMNKYNRTGPGANQAVFGAIVEDTGIQESVNKVQKKKATFELDPDLHRRLKLYAVSHDIHMVEVVEEALNNFFGNDENQEKENIG